MLGEVAKLFFSCPQYLTQGHKSMFSLLLFSMGQEITWCQFLYYCITDLLLFVGDDLFNNTVQISLSIPSALLLRRIGLTLVTSI